MLTPEQMQEFEADGLIRLPGAIPRGDIQEMLDRVWQDLDERFEIRRDAPSTWQNGRPQAFKSLRRSGAFAKMASSAVTEALDELFDRRRWFVPNHWGQVLCSFPTGGSWQLPHQGWHLDFQVLANLKRLYQVKLFVFLDDVEHQGGGALALAGSHRLVIREIDRLQTLEAGKSGPMRKAIERIDPWFRALFSNDHSIDRIDRFMASSTRVDGVDVRVVEMTGEAGDVLLMHPCIFHAITENCGDAPRIMLTERVDASNDRA